MTFSYCGVRDNLVAYHIAVRDGSIYGRDARPSHSNQEPTIPDWHICQDATNDPSIEVECCCQVP